MSFISVSGVGSELQGDGSYIKLNISQNIYAAPVEVVSYTNADAIANIFICSFLIGYGPLGNLGQTGGNYEITEKVTALIGDFQKKVVHNIPPSASGLIQTEEILVPPGSTISLSLKSPNANDNAVGIISTIFKKQDVYSLANVIATEVQS